MRKSPSIGSVTERAENFTMHVRLVAGLGGLAQSTPEHDRVKGSPGALAFRVDDFRLVGHLANGRRPAVHPPLGGHPDQLIAGADWSS